MMKLGGGSRLSSQAARAAFETHRLVTLRIDGFEARRTLYAVHHRDKQVTPAMREPVGLLRARVREDGTEA